MFHPFPTTFGILCCAAMCVATFGTFAHADVRAEFIDPALTDPAIPPLSELPDAATRLLSHSVAIDLAIPRRQQLLVVFPGSGGLPEDYLQLARAGAALGYHTVSLAYPNWPSIEDLISQTGDPNLPTVIRDERLFGEDLTTLVNVSQPGSISNRLIKLIQYLETQHPGEGWGLFLDPTRTPRNAPAPPDVRWSAVVTAGHSQGAGWAGYLTKLAPIVGAAYFSGPGELIEYSPPTLAAWHMLPSFTPAARQYGLVHQREPGASAWQAVYAEFGLAAFGPVVSVDVLSPPYAGSHTLQTNLQPAITGGTHSSTAVDRFTHKQPDGSATLVPAWRFMLASAGGLPCRADVNLSGSVTVQDIFDFLTAYFAGHVLADYNGVSGITVQDIFDFLAAYFAGCA